MKIILKANDCLNYTKTYISIMEQLNAIANCNETERTSISLFLAKHPEIASFLEVEIIDSEKLKENLGYKETIRFYRSVLKSSSIEEMTHFITIIKNAEKEEGPTLYDDLIDVFMKENIKIIFN